MSNFTFPDVNEETKNGYMKVIRIVVFSNQLFFDESDTNTVNSVLNSVTEIKHFTEYCLEQLKDTSNNSIFKQNVVQFVIRLHRVLFNLRGSEYVFPLRPNFQQDARAFQSSSVSDSNLMTASKKVIPLLSLTSPHKLYCEIDKHFQCEANRKMQGSDVAMVRLLQYRMSSVENVRYWYTNYSEVGKFIHKHATEKVTQYNIWQMLNTILKELDLKSDEESNVIPDPSILFATVGPSFPGNRNKELAQQTSTNIIVGKNVNNNISILTFIEIKKYIHFNLQYSVQYSIDEFMNGHEASLNNMTNFFRDLSTYSLINQTTSGLASDGKINIAFELRCDLIDENSNNNFNSFDDFIRMLMTSQKFRCLVENIRNGLPHEEELETILQELRVSNIQDENNFEVVQLIKRNLLQQIVLNFDKIDTEIRIKSQGPISLTPELRSIEKLLGSDFVFLPLDVFNFSSETPFHAVLLSYLFHLSKSKKLRDAELKSLEKLDNVTRLTDQENIDSESHLSLDPTHSPLPSPAIQNQSPDFSNHSSQAQNEPSLDHSNANDSTCDMEDLTRDLLTIKVIDEVNMVDYI